MQEKKIQVVRVQQTGVFLIQIERVEKTERETNAKCGVHSVNLAD